VVAVTRPVAEATLQVVVGLRAIRPVAVHPRVAVIRRVVDLRAVVILRAVAAILQAVVRLPVAAIRPAMVVLRRGARLVMVALRKVAHRATVVRPPDMVLRKVAQVSRTAGPVRLERRLPKNQTRSCGSGLVAVRCSCSAALVLRSPCT
jgi:hypothetical protein